MIVTKKKFDEVLFTVITVFGKMFIQLYLC